MRCLLPTLLAATLGGMAPFPVIGQSDETCVAYMEADAAYAEAEKEAYAAGHEACDHAIAPFVAACEAARKNSGQACNAASKEWNAVAYKPFVTNRESRLRELGIRRDAACREIDAVCKPEPNSETQQAINEACDAASKPVRDALLEEANEVWGRAYSLAYQGPTSHIQSVFQKLVLADRERCRHRFE